MQWLEGRGLRLSSRINAPMRRGYTTTLPPLPLPLPRSRPRRPPRYLDDSRLFSVAARAPARPPHSGVWGSRPNRSKDHATDRRRTAPDSRQSPSDKKSSTSPSSLFQELFPDVDVASASAAASRNNHHGSSVVSSSPGLGGDARHTPPLRDGASVAAEASRQGTLWRESIDTADLRAWLESQARESLDPAVHDGSSRAPPDRDQMPAMLVLSGASKSLAESDFYRVGRQGEHLSGWRNGSVKRAVQAYDRNTLEPLGCYFILFASKAAARAYQQEAFRLHRRGGGGGRGGPSSTSSLDPDFSSGPDAAPDIFTLSPNPHTPLNIRLCNLPPSTAARLNAFSLEGILAAYPGKGSNGTATSTSPTKPASDSHQRVVLSLEGGAVDADMLLSLVDRDGRQRNLPWDVVHARPYLAQKLNGGQKKKAGKQQQLKQEEDDEDVDEEGGEGVEEAAGQLGGRTRIERGDEKLGQHQEDVAAAAAAATQASSSVKSARFVLSFVDVHEARRFVRHWHRRVFALPPPSTQGPAGGHQITKVTVNAMIPW